MKIIVCMKQVPDPQASSTGTTVDSEAKKVIMPQGTPPVLNPYDENALEAALKIKDAGDAHVTVISAGRNLAKPVLRKALAVGADELILLQDARSRIPAAMPPRTYWPPPYGKSVNMILSSAAGRRQIPMPVRWAPGLLRF